jgi:DNA modification methylase
MFPQRTALIEERNRKIIESYLRAWNTLESIAEENNIEAMTVKRIVDSHFDQMAEMLNDFKPLIYGTWNTPRQDHETDHFGSLPQVFMENLLYYHTEPRDIVFDPFAGAGTTIDAYKNVEAAWIPETESVFLLPLDGDTQFYRIAYDFKVNKLYRFCGKKLL